METFNEVSGRELSVAAHLPRADAVICAEVETGEVNAVLLAFGNELANLPLVVSTHNHNNGLACLHRPLNFLAAPGESMIMQLRRSGPGMVLAG